MENIILKVYLQPKSSKNEIVGPYRDGIRVKVSAPPIDGKANAALLKLLAKTWRISSPQIKILKGHHCREKTLKISGVKDQEFTKKSMVSRPPLNSPKTTGKKEPVK